MDPPKVFERIKVRPSLGQSFDKVRDKVRDKATTKLGTKFRTKFIDDLWKYGEGFGCPQFSAEQLSAGTGQLEIKIAG